MYGYAICQCNVYANRLVKLRLCFRQDGDRQHIPDRTQTIFFCVGLKSRQPGCHGPWTILSTSSRNASTKYPYKLLNHGFNIHDPKQCCASGTNWKEFAELKLTHVMPEINTQLGCYDYCLVWLRIRFDSRYLRIRLLRLREVEIAGTVLYILRVP